jgi:hypothetical protein
MQLGSRKEINPQYLLSFGPYTVLHPLINILICTNECALYMNQKPAQFQIIALIKKI